VDSSASGFEIAQREFPDLAWVQHDIADPLPQELRHRFDVVLAGEVIEHLFLPRQLFSRAEEALAPGGRLVLSTPFHGYWKNLALAVTNRYDVHWRPGWDYGHIKFFSQKTLGAMAAEVGWRPVGWKLVGRVPQLAKTMILVAERDPAHIRRMTQNVQNSPARPIAAPVGCWMTGFVWSLLPEQ
jgi:2-polyprenyl-6-hydroxyphenyl methylase/3-demethylubiquinone-9 3-methyltransferase